MKNGNCLLGAIYLMFKKRSRRIKLLKAKKPNGGTSLVPHFILVDNHNIAWHFKRNKDLLPFPFCFFWFEGEIDRYRPYSYTSINNPR